MTAETPASPTQDERVMAALSHISTIIPTLGILASIVIWATQKDKSRFVRFQALQAIAYQIAIIVFFFLGMGCYMLSFFGNFVGFFSSAVTNSTPSPVFFAGFMLPFVVFGLIFVGWLAFLIYAIVAAVQTFQGREFRYLLIGRLIEKSVNKK